MSDSIDRRAFSGSHRTLSPEAQGLDPRGSSPYAVRTSPVAGSPHREFIYPRETSGMWMTVADDLEAVIDDIPQTQQEAARELVAKIQERSEDKQRRALKELIADMIRELDSDEEEGDDE